MQTHQIKRNTKRKKNVQLGRGGKRGKTSGRGHKGQKSRAGNKKRPEIRDIIKKLPKLRGRGKNINTTRKIPHVSVRLSAIETNFKDGDKVTPKSLFDKGLVRKTRGVMPPIKIVGGGKLTKKISVSGLSMTETAEAAIIVKKKTK